MPIGFQEGRRCARHLTPKPALFKEELETAWGCRCGASVTSDLQFHQNPSKAENEYELS